MSAFRMKRLQLQNYRCFEALDLPLEDDLTVLFAENGHGKTAVLSALATGFSLFQRDAPRDVKFVSSRDVRLVTLADRVNRDPAGKCRIFWTAATGDEEDVEWSTANHRPIEDALGRVRVRGERWPLFAWYGVHRLQRGRKAKPERWPVPDRWEAYESSLDPKLDDAPLLQWLEHQVISDLQRRQHGEPERFYEKVVMETTVRATLGTTDAWYDPTERSPVIRFESGNVAPWSELSDGFQVFAALVADIARRAVMLNEMDGAEAPARVEGVVLIDEIDLHLHPRWQRVAVPGLRRAFPRLQFILSTHSPQVLSSVENRQVRWLVDGKLRQDRVFVQGRDTNAILRDHMETDDRADWGTGALRDLHAAIDRGDGETANRLFAALEAIWGDSDPALIRARSFMEWEE